MLADEGVQYILLAAVLRVLRKKGFVAQMPAAAHHRQIDAVARIRLRHSDDVGIGVITGGLHGLLLHHAGQRRNFVAVQRGRFKVQFARRRLHFRLQIVQYLIRLAPQKFHAVGHVFGIAFRVNQPNARRAASVDLIQHTRARTVAVHGFVAGTQAKHLL